MKPTYTVTPEAEPAVRATLELHRATLERSFALNRAAPDQNQSQVNAAYDRAGAYLKGDK